MTNIKVGDKVKAVTANWSRTIGEVGTVEKVDSGRTAMPYRVRWSDDALLWHEAEQVELASPTPVIPDEIEINGAKYRRVIEEAAPEKPEPQAGQVWRDGEARICILTMENKNTHLKDGGAGSWGRDDFAQKGTFIAPSLADALERGLITAADLR